MQRGRETIMLDEIRKIKLKDKAKSKETKKSEKKNQLTYYR